MPRQQLKTAMQTPFTRGTLAIGGKAIEGFNDGFGDQPWGSWIKSQDENYPKTVAAWKLAGFPLELVGRTISGGVNAVRHGTAEAYTQLGGDRDEGRRLGRELAGMLDYWTLTSGQNMPRPRS